MLARCSPTLRVAERGLSVTWGGNGKDRGWIDGIGCLTVFIGVVVAFFPLSVYFLLVCLCVVECLHDIGMIHLLVHHAFTLGKLDGQWMRTDLLLISCLEYDVLL